MGWVGVVAVDQLSSCAVFGQVYPPQDDDNAVEYGGSFYAYPQIEWEYLATVAGTGDMEMKC